MLTLPLFRDIPSEDNSAADTLNQREMLAILALVHYVADAQQSSTDIILDYVEMHFGVADLSKLRRALYDDAVRFLVDLQTNSILH